MRARYHFRHNGHWNLVQACVQYCHLLHSLVDLLLLNRLRYFQLIILLLLLLLLFLLLILLLFHHYHLLLFLLSLFAFHGKKALHLGNELLLAHGNVESLALALEGVLQESRSGHRGRGHRKRRVGWLRFGLCESRRKRRGGRRSQRRSDCWRR